MPKAQKKPTQKIIKKQESSIGNLFLYFFPVIVSVGVYFYWFHQDLNSITYMMSKENIEASLNKNFKGESLIFVTPWNRKGYDYTIQYAKKLNYVSPVWFTVKLINNQGDVSLDGQQDVDKEYCQKLREANPQIKIVPRVYIEFDSREKFLLLNQIKLLKLIKEKILDEQFDGLLFDTPLLSYQEALQISVSGLVKKIKQSLPQNKILIATLVGLDKKLNWSKQFINELTQNVDRLLVCTYDFAQQPEAGVKYLSPLYWLRENIKFFQNYKSKVMFGIPYYGFKVERGQISHILSNDLKSNLEYTWVDNDIKECVYQDGQAKLFYPCYNFLKQRLEFIQENGFTGAFIWEGGQGFKYFYELL